MAALALAALPALGLGGAAAGGASVLGALSGVASAAGIFGTIGKGFADASASNEQATQADLQAGQEQLGAAQRETQMKRQLLQALGQNDVAFAAGGTDTTQGIAANARASAEKDASDEISLDAEDSDFQQTLLRRRAANLRSQAGGQIGGALLSALGQGIDSFSNLGSAGGGRIGGGELGGYGSST